MKNNDITREEFIESVANKCVSRLSEEERRLFMADPEPYNYHFGYGMYIRNHYIRNKGLPIWSFNADDLSHDIIEKIIEMVNSSAE